jgi:hypothetical protein
MVRKVRTLLSMRLLLVPKTGDGGGEDSTGDGAAGRPR